MGARIAGVIAFVVGCTPAGEALPDAAAPPDGGTCPTLGAAPLVEGSWEVPVAQTGPLRFERGVLSTEFLAEGVGVFDVDGDADADVVVPPYWWSSPALERHELGPRRATPLCPETDFGTNYGVYGWDVDRDGDLDAVVSPRSSDAEMIWLENPGGLGRLLEGDWDVHDVYPERILGGNVESVIVAELFPGQPVAIMGLPTGTGGLPRLGWWVPDTTEPLNRDLPWLEHPISADGFRGAGTFVHGFAVGDVNDDLLADVVTPYAWFEQVGPDEWSSHDLPWEDFGGGDHPDKICGEMAVADVDDDGSMDLVCPSPHGFGLSYYRQIPPASPTDAPTFERIVIDASVVSIMHSLDVVDLDGIPPSEIVTGRRRLSSVAEDPGAQLANLLVYFTRTPGPDPTFTPHVIDDEAGVGTHLEVADVSGDGELDLVVANRRGVFLYRRVP